MGFFARLLMLTTCVACSDPPPAEGAPPPTLGQAQPDRGEPPPTVNLGWTEAIATAVDEAYPGATVGLANRDPNAVVQYVHWAPGDSFVAFVTSGVSREGPYPHEFVMRVRHENPPSGNALLQTAPMWPSQVLAELARVESSSPHPFSPGNFIRNVTLDGVPYRHFLFLSEPELPPLSGGGTQPLVFVRVVPLTEAQLRDYEDEALPTNPMLSAWRQRDGQLLVDPNPTAD